MLPKFTSIQIQKRTSGVRSKLRDMNILGVYTEVQQKIIKNIVQLVDLIQEVEDTKPDHLLITGDFNNKEIDRAT